jgi:hypothetical protein
MGLSSTVASFEDLLAAGRRDVKRNCTGTPDVWSQVNQDKMQIFQSAYDSMTRSSRFAAECFCPGVILTHFVDLRLPVAIGVQRARARPRDRMLHVSRVSEVSGQWISC